MTDEIMIAIAKAETMTEAEDIYRPYKQKKKTRATDAKKKGLEPLAEYLLSFPLEGNVEEEASKYVTNLEGKTPEEVEALKKDGMFDADAQKKAVDLALEKINASLSAELKKWLDANYADVQAPPHRCGHREVHG